MTMKRLLGPVTALVLLGACSPPPPEPEPVAEEEIGSHVETQWTEQYEWFVEHSLLVNGMPSEFAAHLTDLSGFGPIVDGSLEVTLLNASGAATQSARVNGVLRAGIFAPILVPEWTGNGTLRLTYTALNGQQDVVTWPVDVVNTPQEAATEAEEDEGIPFLKEQQWRIPFETVPADAEASLRDTMSLPASIEPHPQHTAAVAPAGPGIYVAPGTGVPTPGSRVEAGDLLGYLRPLPGAGDDWGSFGADLVRARSTLAQATRELERAEQLVAAGAAPERRLHEAETSFDVAKAELEVLVARDGVAGPSIDTIDLSLGWPLVAPLGGVIAESAVTSGEPVGVDETLFQIVDLDRLVVRVEVPEPDFVQLLSAHAAAAPIDAQIRPAAVGLAGDWTETSRLLDIGTQVDPGTRTARLRFELRGSGNRFRPGMSVDARVGIGAARPAMAIPATAVIDLAGVSVVYVQLGGETFEERVIRTGSAAGGLVEITSGLQVGDRVVTQGAYQVRLAALSPDAAPAHSH